MFLLAASRHDCQHLRPVERDRSAALYWLYKLSHQQPLFLRGSPVGLRIMPAGNLDWCSCRVYDGGSIKPFLKHRDEAIFPMEADFGNTAHLDLMCLHEHLRTNITADEKSVENSK